MSANAKDRAGPRRRPAKEPGVTRGVRRSSGPLDARSQAVLLAVIGEYVASATPVGSRTLVERYPLGVSSATVRNILAELEIAGYLDHPHTSAGRVPTDAGYRFYVEALVGERSLPPVEQLMIRHQFGQIEFASDQWFRLAATTLATATLAAGIATAAKPRAARIRRVEMIRIGDRMASLIVVLNEGSVKQALMTIDPGTADEELEETAQRLNRSCDGLSAADLAERLRWFEDAPADDPVFSLVRRAGDRALAILRDFDGTAVEQLFSDGLLHVMAEPEFAASEKLRRVFAALENRQYLGELIEDVTRAGDLRVYIGRENRAAEMADVALVLAPYGRPGAAVGVVGVLGPTRLRYPQAIGTVRFVSSLMNDLVDHLYA
jgi:heat-inducible transcriptional repressor